MFLVSVPGVVADVSAFIFSVYHFNVSVPGVVADVSAFIFSIYHFKCNHHRTFMIKE